MRAEVAPAVIGAVVGADPGKLGDLRLHQAPFHGEVADAASRMTVGWEGLGLSGAVEVQPPATTVQQRPGAGNGGGAPASWACTRKAARARVTRTGPSRKMRTRQTLRAYGLNKTLPPFITNLTRITASISSRGLPSSAIRSARYRAR